MNSRGLVEAVERTVDHLHCWGSETQRSVKTWSLSRIAGSGVWDAIARGEYSLQCLHNQSVENQHLDEVESTVQGRFY